MLWFAFILLSLSYWTQPTPKNISTPIRCDLLSFYYLCRTGNNYISSTCYRRSVVICFHFTIFVVLETTQRHDGHGSYALWFAFILLSLSYWKQQSERLQCIGVGCDLLSFYYLCRTGNNTVAALSQAILVVICFHFTIFVVLETTRSEAAPEAVSCDLLSFYYLCRTGNNRIYIICCISVCYKDNWNTKNVVSDRM